MKEIKTNNTRTYDAGENFLVDIVILPDEYEAWIYKKDSGYKSLMFGLLKNQPPYDKDETNVTYDEFIEFVAGSLNEYIDDYIGDMEEIEQYHFLIGR